MLGISPTLLLVLPHSIRITMVTAWLVGSALGMLDLCFYVSKHSLTAGADTLDQNYNGHCIFLIGRVNSALGKFDLCT